MSMEQRTIGRVGRAIGVVGLGAWQLGSDWGEVSDADAAEVLDAAVDAGVTFIDTADVYGDGRSERSCGALLARQGASGLFVATKMGQRVDQLPENFNLTNFLAWNDRSRRNLGVEAIDLVQLHCPPTAVYHDDAVFAALDEMIERGRIRHYGVSVETCEQALSAIVRPNVATVQIILNCYRL
jgi:aryl-alcohol dehydrogenase-like predicted oxidoreductase